MENIAIIDYGSGNLRSVFRAFERVRLDHDLDVAVAVTSDPAEVQAADRIVLPGVGAFGACMRGLAAVPGMIEALEKSVLGAKQPFLGICVGMQLLASRGLEFETAEGLGWIPGEVLKIAPGSPGLKVPHMGWNTVSGSRHPVLPEAADAYFVHSYHFVPEDPAHGLATVDYGGPLAAAVGRDNILGVQFHPEKSQANGLALIRNFLTWEVS